MAGETQIQIVKANTASTVSRAATPQKDVVQNNSGTDSNNQVDNARAEEAKVFQEEKQTRDFNEQDLSDFVNEIESSIQNVQRDLRFSVHKDSGETVIKVVDSKTDEVIRQIPSEELVELKQRIQSFNQGSLLDDEV